MATKAAKRAAEDLARCGRVPFDAVDHWAELIDQSTGLPLLLAAVESTMVNGHYRECLAGKRGHGDCSLVCERFRAALSFNA